MPMIPPVSLLTFLFKQQTKLYQKQRFSKKLPKVPWFNDNCKTAIKERKEAQQKFFFFFLYNPTLSNVQNFKLLRAKARHVVKQQKKELVEAFL